MKFLSREKTCKKKQYILLCTVIDFKWQFWFYRQNRKVPESAPTFKYEGSPTPPKHKAAAL